LVFLLVLYIYLSLIVRKKKIPEKEDEKSQNSKVNKALAGLKFGKRGGLWGGFSTRL